eukprot:gene5671-18610_t
MNQGKERHSLKQPKDGLARLEAEFQKHEAKVRAVKAAGKVMESDPEALMAISKLQAAARKVLVAKYGAEPYMIEVKLAFPESMPDYATAGKDGTMLFLMAPAAHVPYGVTYFMELVDGWKSGSFHRMAGHVLQAQASVKSGRLPGLAYQEPGGPGFYISLIDNTYNHGPGSQGSKTEADTCFGRLWGKESKAVAERMKKQPGAAPGAGWVSPPSNYVEIVSIRFIDARVARVAA